MDRFIKECRREWKRLGVPDAVANEMAADLATDLKEAESEGASAEEVLGNGAFDARSFAALWAAERGVTNPPPVRPRFPGRSPLLVAIVALTVVAAVGGGLVIGSRLGSPLSASLAGPPFRRILCRPLGVGFTAPAPIGREVRIPPCPRPPFVLPGSVIRLPVGAPSPAVSRVGWILFIVGIVGIVLVALIWRVVPGPWSRRRMHVESRNDSG